MAMNLEQMRECKHALGYSNETIAELSGVPVATVRKIFGGVTRNPRQKTMEALTKVLQKGMSRENDTNAGFMSGPGSSAALSGRGTSYDDIPENAAGVRETSSGHTRISQGRCILWYLITSQIKGAAVRHILLLSECI